MRTSILVFYHLLLVAANLFGQNNCTVKGKITNEEGFPVPFVNVVIKEFPQGTVSGDDGSYEIKFSLKNSQNIELIFSHIGYNKKSSVLSVEPDKTTFLDILLIGNTHYVKEIEIIDEQDRFTNLIRIDPKNINYLPNAGGGVEALIKTLPGVSSSDEMSSQYSVRGGNYDENLVYINDIEIYRPFLVSSGKSEGLSIANADMISSLHFSAGGFDAKFGDKMSSVLDIKYKKPEKFGGTISAGILGEALQLEGGSNDHRLTYLFGYRRKTTRYLLNTLETTGDYKPSFNDIQTFISYDITPELELTLLGYYGKNNFWFVPTDRETRFGTISEAFQFKVYFEGQEVDKFSTILAGTSLNYHASKDLNLKFITSAYKSNEFETYDVEGQYWIDQVETDFGDSTFGDVAYNKGAGGYLVHARNRLDIKVYNTSVKADYLKPNHFFQSGITYQYESINDKINEWTMFDSAGYALSPSITDDIVFFDVVKSKITIGSNRLNGYIQDRWTLSEDKGVYLTTGIRSSYWDVNNQFTLSPRMAVSIKPKWQKDFLFRFAMGFYHQPPFYREMRDINGNINMNVMAQRAIHFVIGSDLNFKAWGRPFKYVTEIYYKKLDNLIPYEIDNLKIRYLSNRTAHGYATGVDMRINGDFVPGIESWFSLSAMQTQEDVDNDFYIDKNGNTIEPGYIPRPADQRVNVGIFFQDYLPKFPTYKVHLNLLFGSSLPFGPPDHNRYKDTLRIPPYKRVDIGFSKLIISDKQKKEKVLGSLNSIWISLEVLNLLGVSNTISYIWIKDIYNVSYAVPNHLTGRQLNIRLIARF